MIYKYIVFFAIILSYLQYRNINKTTKYKIILKETNVVILNIQNKYDKLHQSIGL